MIRNAEYNKTDLVGAVNKKSAATAPDSVTRNSFVRLGFGHLPTSRNTPAPLCGSGVFFVFVYAKTMLAAYGHVTEKVKKDSADRMQAFIKSLS